MKEAEITKILKGETIVKVMYPTNEDDEDLNREPDINSKTEFEFDAENFYLFLNTGEVIRVWVSEWGGIQLFKDFDKVRGE